MSANSLSYYNKTKAKCQCHHSDDHPISLIKFKTGPLNGVVIDHTYDVFLGILAVCTLGLTNWVNGGLKCSSHEYFEAWFWCLLCGVWSVRTIEFGGYGVRWVNGYYSKFYKQRNNCKSSLLTFGDLRECVNIMKKNYGKSDYSLVNKNCYTFAAELFSRIQTRLKSFRNNFIVIGINECSISLVQSYGADKAIKNGINEGKTISVVAISHHYKFCIVFTDGSATHAGMTEKFLGYFRSMTRSNIKQITFGPDGTFAILDKSGCLAGYVYDNDDGPFDAVMKHQRNIDYIAMSCKKGEWIVGYDEYGFVSKGLNKKLLSKLHEINKQKKEIYGVRLGLDTSRYVVHYKGYWHWSLWGKESTFDEDMRSMNIRLIDIL